MVRVGVAATFRGNSQEINSTNNSDLVIPLTAQSSIGDEAKHYDLSISCVGLW